MAESLSLQESVLSEGTRADGRRPNEMRHMSYHIGMFGQGDGNAYLEVGNTHVLAVVYGPRPAANSLMVPNALAINCKYNSATLTPAEKAKRPPNADCYLAINLRQVLMPAIKLEVHPRKQIDIDIHVLQDDGGAFCAGVNAAALAVLHAGIPLRTFVCACTATIPTISPAVPLLDATRAEENAGDALLTVACLPIARRNGSVVLLELSHKLHMEKFDAVLKCATQGCKEIEIIMDKAMRDYTMKAYPG